jgi:hypothetical protein
MKHDAISAAAVPSRARVVPGFGQAPARDGLPFAAQFLLWSWRVLRRAYPWDEMQGERVRRAYDVTRSPRAFPALYALVCLEARSPVVGCRPHCVGCQSVSLGEQRLLNAVRHLQVGNDALGRKAVERAFPGVHPELGLVYVGRYALEMAAAGQWMTKPGGSIR